MADKFNAEEAMSMMMDGMPDIITDIPEQESTTPAPTKRGRKPSTAKKADVRISSLIDEERFGQMRTIIEKEGVTMRGILEAGIDLYIKAYTAKHGPIKAKKIKKAEATDLI